MRSNLRSTQGQTFIEYLFLFLLIGILVYGVIQVINDKHTNVIENEELPSMKEVFDQETEKPISSTAQQG